MTTTYSPDGQTAPVDEYTFPQDVIDLVVVETVNNPFATAADNIAWLFLAMGTTVSVSNFGAVGNGIADDAAAIQAAIDYVETKGFGIVVFPPGTYRATVALDVPPSVMLLGVRGESVLSHDSAGDNVLDFSGSATKLNVVQGLSIEGAQANTGDVFACDGAARVTLIDCTVNASGSNLAGYILHSTFGGTVAKILDCNIVAVKTGRCYSVTGSGSLLKVVGGKLTMAGAATLPMIGADGGGARYELWGVEFTQASAVTAIVSFVNGDAGPGCMIGCRFNVTDAGALDFTCALRSSNTYIWETRANNFNTLQVVYELVSTWTVGTDLQLLPHLRTTMSLVDKDIGNQYRSVLVESTNATDPPALTLDEGLFIGQRLHITVYNAAASRS